MAGVTKYWQLLGKKSVILLTKLASPGRLNSNSSDRALFSQAVIRLIAYFH
jgi:hypothetical protein